MTDGWLRDHVAVLERTLARLRDERTSRAAHLVERYGAMLHCARLELERRECD